MQRLVLSASRRTDIPAFYMPWFMKSIECGVFDVPHPYGGLSTPVPATVDRVHTIVFWSKDFGHFLNGGYGDQLVRKGFRLFFNFTINAEHPVLEPDVPCLETRIGQLSRLCARFGAERVQWRFDPICYYKTSSGRIADTTAGFEAIARQVASLGVSRCITSFVDPYRKVLRRFAASPLTFFDPPLHEKTACIMRMERCLDSLAMALHVCCEKPLLDALPAESKVRGAACIPNHLLAGLHGADVSLRKDSGQRAAAGCGCRISRDIGSYALHPCGHNCLFCYANPHSDQKRFKVDIP
jgi:hypothetical protein